MFIILIIDSILISEGFFLGPTFSTEKCLLLTNIPEYLNRQTNGGDFSEYIGKVTTLGVAGIKRQFRDNQ
jgi:hypothetical protein|tara:strand:+ start:173 stop:382 length:210 start_codon:yes stop_codon:yes gene_type:complete